MMVADQTRMTRADPVSVYDLLLQHSRSRPDHPFLIFAATDAPERVYSYAEFLDCVERLAQGLALRGIKVGDRIAVHLDNCPEFLMMFCAAAAMGAVVVNTNTGNSLDEQRHCMTLSKPKAAVTTPLHRDLIAQAWPDLDWIACVGEEGPDGFDALMRSKPDGAFAPAAAMADLCVQFTSGSTSRPKGVVWTNANALWAGRVSAAHQGLTPEDRHFCVLPLFHTNALSYSWLSIFHVGGTFVFTNRFSASRYWEVAQRHGCTWASITAFCYRALAAQPRPEHHSFRRWGIALQDPLVVEAFGIPATSWWGMSETLTQGIVSDPREVTPLGAVGRAAPEYEIKIEVAAGRAAMEGETGQIWIRGTRGMSLFARYLEDPVATSAAFDADGWFDTGDLAHVLPSGYLRFEGRVKDMLKVSGENVAAAEIERILGEVAGVAEVAVIGVPDPMRDEVPVGFLRLHEGAEAARAISLATRACEAGLAGFKQPRRVIVLSDFPRVNIGKISKPELRRLYAAGEWDEPTA